MILSLCETYPESICKSLVCGQPPSCFAVKVISDCGPIFSQILSNVRKSPTCRSDVGTVESLCFAALFFTCRKGSQVIAGRQANLCRTLLHYGFILRAATLRISLIHMFCWQDFCLCYTSFVQR